MDILFGVLTVISVIILGFVIHMGVQKTSLKQQELMQQRFQHFEDRLEERFVRSEDQQRTYERVSNAQLLTYFDQLTSSVHKDLQETSQVIESKFNMLDMKVNQRLNEGFEKTNETFTNIVERLGKIDEAQKKIDALSTDIVSLQDVLTDKKARGTFGEVQLYQILSAVFGERNDAIYQMQKGLSTGVRADAMIYAPEPLGTIAVDSKFPLENYRRLVDESFNSEHAIRLRKEFTNDCKRHIDAIATKYIIVNETSDQAFMFVPAEAVYAYINAYMQDVLVYAQKRRVWIVSPTTFMSTLTLLQTMLVNIERDKYAAIIQKELKLLMVEFNRYRTRWDALSNHIDQVNKDVKDIHVTTHKITQRFESIASVEGVKEIIED